MLPSWDTSHSSLAVPSMLGDTHGHRAGVVGECLERQGGGGLNSLPKSAAHLAKGFLDHPDAFSHAGLRGLHLIDFLTEILAEICGLGQVGGGG